MDLLVSLPHEQFDSVLRNCEQLLKTCVKIKAVDKFLSFTVTADKLFSALYEILPVCS
jgi:hypothetical protein